MCQTKAISERRACYLVGISRTVLHYQPVSGIKNQELQQRIVDLAQERRRFGYKRIHALLRREGVEANHKKVFRLYQ
jgi:putative transposase